MDAYSRTGPRSTITAIVQEAEPTYTELVDEVTRRLGGSFDGNVDWHTMTVKLDLEARGVIERRARSQSGTDSRGAGISRENPPRVHRPACCEKTGAPSHESTGEDPASWVRGCD